MALNTQFKLLLIVLGILLLAGIGYAVYQSADRTISDDTPPVGRVNGETITQMMLDTQVDQLVATQQIPPLEGSDEEKLFLKQAVLEQMVSERLILKDASEQNISISEEDVTTQFDSIAQQYGSEELPFEEFLAQQGMTEDGFRKSLHDQLVLETYFNRIQEEHDISVSEEEIRGVYDTQIGDQADEIPFEEVSEQIRQQLVQQKMTEVLTQIIDRLKETAEIEILI